MALWVTVGLAICVVVLLIVLAYICQKKIRESCEEEEENAGKASPPHLVAHPAGGDGAGDALTSFLLWHINERFPLVFVSSSQHIFTFLLCPSPSLSPHPPALL